MASDNEPTPQAGLPPYTAYSSFKTSLAALKTLVPQRVDRSIWGNKFSGSVVTQMLTAYRFMGLINMDGAPQPRLYALVESLDTPQWKTALRDTLEFAYPPVMALALDKVSPTQFSERFREAYKAEGDTGRKCMTFFLQAAKEAEIDLSPFLLTGAKPRATGQKRKVKSKREPDAAAHTGDNGAGGDPPPKTVNVTERLLSKFPEFDPAWPEPIKKQWFDGFAELMNRTKDS